MAKRQHSAFRIRLRPEAQKMLEENARAAMRPVTIEAALRLEHHLRIYKSTDAVMASFEAHEK